MNSNQLFELFRAYAEQIPSFLALLAGLVFAFTRWKRFPKVALTLAIGLGILLFQQVIFTVIYNVVPGWFIRSVGSQDIQKTIQNVYLVLGLISNTVAAAGFALILAAIFMQRKLKLARNVVA